MPELPDVEIYKQYLDETALQRTIAAAELREPRLLGQSSARALQRALAQHRLTESRRLGKWLFAHTDAGPWLVLHFGMTGALECYEDAAREPRHLGMALHFADGGHLAYVDRRKLGTLDLADDPAAYAAAHALGPDALGSGREIFLARLAERRGGIKSALMDQSLIAGIGNVYADEILFQADVHPLTPLPALNARQRRRLYDVMQKVLRTAIARDAERTRMPRNYLLPKRRAGTPCPRCGGTIRQISVNGRSTYYCERHQAAPA